MTEISPDQENQDPSDNQVKESQSGNKETVEIDINAEKQVQAPQINNSTSDNVVNTKSEILISKGKESHKKTMREILIGKVVVNITVGQSGEPLDRAMTILENLTAQKPVVRRAKQTIRNWGIRRNEPISCMVTLRKDKGEEFLRKTFPAIGNRIKARSFDKQGNFAFGIHEHIDIPGQRYDPSLGIVGMDIMATVERPGYRITRKRRSKSRVSKSHRVTREESIEFIKQSFGVEVGLPNE
jgi:large subunit ribosomal protein L5